MVLITSAGPWITLTLLNSLKLVQETTMRILEFIGIKTQNVRTSLRIVNIFIKTVLFIVKKKYSKQYFYENNKVLS